MYIDNLRQDINHMHDRTSHIATAGYFLHVLISSSDGAQLWAEREDMPSNVQATTR